MLFKKGDKIIGNDSADSRYSITIKGWIGIVTDVDGDTIRVIGDNFEGHVSSYYFKLFKRGGKNMGKKKVSLKQKYVLVSDNEYELQTDCLFDTKKEAMEWVEENETDPILCKLVPVSKISFKAVEEKLK